ncbi:hypothetical protein HYW20_08075 [Candidatus Woesearchaeota archaeon]|nr:hypothetical protein [Candidatus Woesearchaeota archaeon]
MGFFNIFFKSTGEIAIELNRDNSELIREWESYVKTLSEKKNLTDNVPIDIVRLTELLRIGLDNIEIEEKDDAEIMKDLKSVSHDKRIQRVHRLKDVLDHALSKYRYVYALLEQIHHVLIREHSLAKAISRNSQDRKLIKYLQEQVDLEMALTKKINQLNKEHGPNTFARLFSDLARGEATIKVLDAIGKRHFDRMHRLFENEVEKSITIQWVNKVVESIEDRVHDAEADGLMMHHRYVHHEFVNSELFVELVRDTIKSLKPKKRVSERMIQIFVEDFRRGFNERIY